MNGIDAAYLRSRCEFIAYPAFTLVGLFTALPIGTLKDFGSFHASGAAAARGDNPYGVYPLTNFVETAWFTGFNQNLNPPTVLPLFQALSTLSPGTAFLLWWLVSVLCLVAFLWLLRRWNPGQVDALCLVWICSLGAVGDTLYLGQIYMPLALCAAAAWTRIRDCRADLLAGILIGILVATKPNFAVWPILLFLAGGRRCAVFAGATAFVIAAASLHWYGVEAYRQWSSLVAADSARLVFPTNGSVIGFFARLGRMELGYAAAAMLLLAAAAWAWWRKPDLATASSVGIAVALLASPIAWAHYTLFLVPLIVAQWRQRDPLVFWIALTLSFPLGSIASIDAHSTIGRFVGGTFYVVVFAMLLALALRSAPVKSREQAKEAAASSLVPA